MKTTSREIIARKLRTLWRKSLLTLRGRVRHHDRFGLSYWLWTDTRAMGRQKLEPGTDDTGVPEQLKRIYQLIGQPDRDLISVDVGAYIGVISLAMSHFGPSKHTIHSFEADSLNFSRLRQNVTLIPNTSITTHNKAVADFEGESTFTRYKDPGNNHLGTRQNHKINVDSLHQVQVTTLDTFVRETGIDIIDVLKIDVEGFDLSVLRGAKRILDQERINTIIIETPTNKSQRKEVNDFLNSHGFVTAYIVRNSKKLIETSESVFTSHAKTPLNILAIKSKLIHTTDEDDTGNKLQNMFAVST